MGGKALHFYTLETPGGGASNARAPVDPGQVVAIPTLFNKCEIRRVELKSCPKHHSHRGSKLLLLAVSLHHTLTYYLKCVRTLPPIGTFHFYSNKLGQGIITPPQCDTEVVYSLKSGAESLSLL